jgi:hypothetical protein
MRNNITYLMKDEKREFCLFKVGFASNLMSRVYQYTTHNPLNECISYVETMEKSKKKVEEIFHEEIIKRGYTFVNAKIDNKKTEWFKVSYDDPFYTELNEKGLCAFNCGKRRKDHGAFIVIK